MLPFEIGKSYTFNTLVPALLGTTVSNARLIGILDYDAASSFENINLKYRTIYPVLPAGTPDTPSSCIYYRFRTESGESIILADQWIQESTIETILYISFSINVNNASLNDITKARNAMLAAGFTNFNIKQL